jgi:hypothetical protein
VRHHLVQRIIRAYDEHKVRVAEEQNLQEAKSSGNGKAAGVAITAEEKISSEPVKTEISE